MTSNAAAFARGCAEHGMTLYVAEPNYRDGSRDRDENRQRLFRSKLDKYPKLDEVRLPDRATMKSRFGNATTDNDWCDMELLAITEAGVVDFLITEDRGVHRRSARAGMDDRVLSVTDALAWIHQAFEPSDVELPHVEEVPAYQVELSDPFFDSLREDYASFDDWFVRKCVRSHRPCWVIRLQGRLAGIVIRKTEGSGEADCTHRGNRILKVCTFKISPDFQGEKFGEQLLKQVLWWAQRNRYDAVYLTAFPKHAELIDLLTAYGFEATLEVPSGERLLERPLYHGTLDCSDTGADLVVWNRHHYPRFFWGEDTRIFCVPIRAGYHERLFPERAHRRQSDLFRDILGEGSDNRTPGNTIRKVYLCRAATKQLRPGDVLAFYMSQDQDFVDSQCVTTLGVVEGVGVANSLEEVVRATARRSVFSLGELQELVDRRPSPLRVIDFSLVAHLAQPVRLSTLKESGVLQGHPPQTIMECKGERGSMLRDMLNGELKGLA